MLIYLDAPVDVFTRKLCPSNTSAFKKLNNQKFTGAPGKLKIFQIAPNQGHSMVAATMKISEYAVLIYNLVDCSQETSF